ncbi:MAG: M20/M25/M40 family metallo-hydrolase [Candidatus Aminicenantes bacterium]|nr:M20/M25/M40 family metallo-hydrolase [Candidatus Aminicenantes bacterium]
MSRRPDRIHFSRAAAAACLAFWAASCGPKAPEERPYAALAEELRAEGLRSEGAFAVLARLTSEAGPRLAGSPGVEKAVALMRGEMERLGLETWLEPVTVQHWVRGDSARAEILTADGLAGRPLAVAALGWSVASPADGIEARVFEVSSFEELEARKAEVAGRIAFFNRPMDRTSLDTFRSYGEAAQFRARGASEAARSGAAAVLVRSATQRIDDHPHTGMVAYEPDIPKIPAAAVSTAGAEFLSAALKKDPELKLRLSLNPRTLPDVPSANVVGQIRGTEKPEEIVLIGAHLDSWDLGTGAHDDGAGCAQVVEALRLILESGRRPKRTIRGVLFMNEEFGASGGRDYAKNGRRAAERHIAAMESDRGGFLPLVFAVGGGPKTLARFGRWEYLLAPLGLLGMRPGGGGADIGPIVEKGAIPMGFVPDAQSYFDLHHSALDVLESVHPRHLELGAIVLAVMAFIVAEEGI